MSLMPNINVINTRRVECSGRGRYSRQFKLSGHVYGGQEGSGRSGLGQSKKQLQTMEQPQLPWPPYKLCHVRIEK